MWPEPTEAVEQTVDAEAIIEELYAKALLRWAPLVQAAVLPTLMMNVITSSGELPPDPDAVANTQSQWEALVAEIVLPGVAALWADGALAAAIGLGIPAAVSAATGLIEGVAGAFNGPQDDFMEVYARSASLVPNTVYSELRKMISAADELGLSIDELRAQIRDATMPGSEMMRQTSKRLGYHGASVLNDALVSVVNMPEWLRIEDVYKCWTAILDERTRDTHWTADGQVVPIGGSFIVGGCEMYFPGDPRGPAREVCNCRCRLSILERGESPRRRHVSAAETARRAKRGVVRTEEDSEGPIPAPIAASVSASEENTVATNASTTLQVEIPVEVPAGAEQQEMFRTFSDGVIAFIGTPTSDARLLANDIDLTFRTMPLPLMWMRQHSEGHMDSFTIGVIEAARAEDGKVFASGYLLNTPEADQAAEQLAHGITRPSVDLGGVEWHLTNENGEEISEEQWWDLPLDAKVFRTFTRAELMGMTLVATPAFGDTSLSLNTERESRTPGLVAAAEPVRTYVAARFADPQLREPTLPTIDDDGRIYGHIACWGQCHRSVQTSCVVAPRSRSGYSHFHTSPAVRLDDGTRLPVGRLTIGTGHAPDKLGGIPAQAHYDNTGTCWALVRVGEDAHGIWFSGVAAPWATPEQIEQGLAAPLSGDWRDFGQGLELVAALSVNTPGFPIARGREDAQGRPVALIASLGPGPETVVVHRLTREDIKWAVAEALADRQFIAERDAALARAAALVPVKTPRDQISELLALAEKL